MKRVGTMLALASTCTLAVGGGFALAPAAAVAMPVFDATNYAQNLLQAARALEQINNQIRSLQNEAGMLEAMARNLERLDFPERQTVNASLQEIDPLLA